MTIHLPSHKRVIKSHNTNSPILAFRLFVLAWMIEGERSIVRFRPNQLHRKKLFTAQHSSLFYRNLNIEETKTKDSDKGSLSKISPEVLFLRSILMVRSCINKKRRRNRVLLKFRPCSSATLSSDAASPFSTSLSNKKFVPDDPSRRRCRSSRDLKQIE